MNFENLKARKTKYVVTGIVVVAIIIVISIILVLVSSDDSSTGDNFSSNQILMSENITTESTTTTSNTESSSTTVTTSTITSTTVSSTTRNKTTTKKKTESTIEVQTARVIKAKTQATNRAKVTLKSNKEIAKEVWQGLWGNGTERKKRLTEAGYDYNAIQKIVNDLVRVKTTPKVVTTTKTVETVETVETTTNPTEVSSEITETETQTTEQVEVPSTDVSSETTETTETTTTTVTTEAETQTTEQVEVALKTNEEIAQEVIDGLWGNNADRKKRLTEAGYDYNTIQKIVNELVKNVVSTPTNIEPTGSSISYVKNFSRGTFYAYGGARKGGSGRQLIDCSCGDGTVKGSIASSYLYYNYGYNYNGKRTMVYLEISGYPSMNGYYYLDDCDAGNSNVIDFFYLYNSNCQFQYQGVVSVDCYIVAY